MTCRHPAGTIGGGHRQGIVPAGYHGSPVACQYQVCDRSDRRPVCCWQSTGTALCSATAGRPLCRACRSLALCRCRSLRAPGKAMASWYGAGWVYTDAVYRPCSVPVRSPALTLMGCLWVCRVFSLPMTDAGPAAYVGHLLGTKLQMAAHCELQASWQASRSSKSKGSTRQLGLQLGPARVLAQQGLERASAQMETWPSWQLTPTCQPTSRARTGVNQTWACESSVAVRKCSLKL